LHQYVPESVQKEIMSSFGGLYDFDDTEPVDNVAESAVDYNSIDNIGDIIKNLEIEMRKAAKELAFEKAARLRDRIKELKDISLF